MADKSAFIRAIGDRAFWNISYKHRKVLIPILIALIFIGSLVLIQSYVSMQNRLRQLSSYEPVYVLAVKKHFNVGDVITRNDVFAKLFYKKEFEQVTIADEKTGMPKPALVEVDYNSDTDQLSGINGILGRVVKTPVLKDSFLRIDALAEPGALPGLQSLIAEGHSLLDALVDQLGYNIFIKPGDYVDLYENTKTGTKIIGRDIEVLLVDSLPVGQAPFQVQVNPKFKRNLTLSVPEEIYKRAIAAQRANSLIVTYNNDSTIEQIKSASNPNPIKRKAAAKAKPFNPFQQLIFIKGNNKEVLGNGGGQ